MLKDKRYDPKCRFILSTIHSSKGLEYDRVILMDAIDGVFPALTENGIPEEERRLFYVGMTRAVNDLTILCYNGERSSLLNELKPVTFARKAGTAKTTERQKPTPAVKPTYEYLMPKKQTTIARLSVEEGDRVIHKKYGRGPSHGRSV